MTSIRGNINNIGILLNRPGGTLTQSISDTIIQNIQQHPQSAAQKYKFEHLEIPVYVRRSYYPLFQAILLDASIEVVEAIYNAYPQAIQEKCYDQTALITSIKDFAPKELVLFLMEKWPQAVQEEFDNATALHCAIYNHAPFEVQSALLAAWPDAAKVTNEDGLTPLFLFLLVDSTPSVETIALYLNYHPDILKDTNDKGETILHFVAKQHEVPMDITLFLLENHPAAIVEKNNNGKTPLEVCDRESNNDVYEILNFVSQLFLDGKPNDENWKQMKDYFKAIEWWYGISLAIGLYPDLATFRYEV